jgi:hypothetical protein
MPPNRFVKNKINYPSKLKELYIPITSTVIDLINLPELIEKVIISHRLIKKPTINFINKKKCPLLKGNIKLVKRGDYIFNDFIKLFY